MGSFQVVGNGYVQTFSQQRLATKGVPDWYRETYQKYTFRQGISTIEELQNSLLKEGSEPIIPVPLEYYSFFEKGTNVNVTRAYLTFSSSDLEKIIEAVRTKTVELLVLLEKNFGVLDDLDINLGDYRVGEIKKSKRHVRR